MRWQRQWFCCLSLVRCYRRNRANLHQKGLAKSERTVANPADSDAETTEQQRAAFVAFAQQFDRVFSRCTDALEPVSSEIEQPQINRFRIYEIGEEAKEICGEVSMDIRRLTVPATLDRDIRRDLDDVQNTCSLAAVSERLTADSLMKAVDDDFRPSRVSDMSEASEASLRSKTACLSGWVRAANELGVDPSSIFAP